MDPIAFLNEALVELRHVRWPTRQQAIRLSAIVIAFVGICALAFGLLDSLISEVIILILNVAS
ncbi:MAG: preprotein translocase subunit SecE [Candidatus Peribacteraceae bacterium]|nr:preprotein translocase subunit SecE [Candidatus Peribacteraceae bacterium]